jgi:hypothetical protein
MVAASAVSLGALGLPGVAAAANPPACDTNVYPVSFLVIDGSTFTGNTRYLELRQNPHATDSLSGQSDPEYPFPVNVQLSNGGSLNYTAHDYAKDQFPVKFAPRSITAGVTATYVEDHTEEGPGPLIPVHTVRCTRTISASFKAPPKPKKTKKHRRGHHGGGGQGEDDD